jgi:hypothetical protein
MTVRYMVLLDGKVCEIGLAWREALVEASQLLRVLATMEPDDEVVTISEMQLGEPRLSWRRVGRGWECVSEPVWFPKAA